MNINFNFDRWDLCENVNELVISLFTTYYKDKSFRNSVDEFYKSFNEYNSSDICFLDLIDIHKNNLFSPEKIKLLSKSLDGLKYELNINLKFDNWKEISFNLTSGIIKNTKNDVNRINNWDLEKISWLIIDFIDSLQQKINSILEYTDNWDKEEKLPTIDTIVDNNVTLDDKEIALPVIENPVLSQEEKFIKNRNEKGLMMVELLKNNKEVWIKVIHELSQSEKQSFFNFICQTIVDKWLAKGNSKKVIGVLSKYLWENVSAVEQTIRKLYKKDNYSFQKNFLEWIYDKIIELFKEENLEWPILIEEPNSWADMVFTEKDLHNLGDTVILENNSFDLNTFIDECKWLKSDDLVVKIRELDKDDCIIFLQGFVEYLRTENTIQSDKIIPAITEVLSWTNDITDGGYKKIYWTLHYFINLEWKKFPEKLLNRNIDLFSWYINNLNKELLNNENNDITNGDEIVIPTSNDTSTIWSDLELWEINSFDLDSFIVECTWLESNDLVIKIRELNRNDCISFLKSFLEYSKFTIDIKSKLLAAWLTEIFTWTSHNKDSQYRNTYQLLNSFVGWKAKKLSKKVLDTNIYLFIWYIESFNQEKWCEIVDNLKGVGVVIDDNEAWVIEKMMKVINQELPNEQIENANITRTKDIKWLIVFINDVLDRVWPAILWNVEWKKVEWNIMMSEWNFNTLDGDITQDVLYGIGGTIDSVRFKNIFRVVSMDEDFPKLVELFLSWENKCSDKYLSEIFPIVDDFDTNDKLKEKVRTSRYTFLNDESMNVSINFDTTKNSWKEWFIYSLNSFIQNYIKQVWEDWLIALYPIENFEWVELDVNFFDNVDREIWDNWDIFDIFSYETLLGFLKKWHQNKWKSVKKAPKKTIEKWTEDELFDFVFKYWQVKLNKKAHKDERKCNWRSNWLGKRKEDLKLERSWFEWLYPLKKDLPYKLSTKYNKKLNDIFSHIPKAEVSTLITNYLNKEDDFN